MAWVDQRSASDEAQALYRVGREAFADVELEPLAFARHLDGIGAGPEAAAHAAELYLACGCAAGDRAALAHFERELMPQAFAAVRRVDAAADFVDEVMQAVRTRLFVATQGLPRIAEYAGRGPLSGWLRSVAVRTALNAVDARAARLRPVTSSGPVTSAASEAGSVELELLKRQFGPAFAAALKQGLAALEPRDVAVFRMHYLEGVTVSDVAEVLQVDRSTVTRWMTQAKERLREGIVEQLKLQLRLADSDVESLTRLLRQQAEVSLGPLLREVTP